MSNEQRLIALWVTAGQSIDPQRLRIFRLMTAYQQREIVATIERELTTYRNREQQVVDQLV